MRGLFLLTVLASLSLALPLFAAKDSVPKGFTGMFDTVSIADWHYLPADFQFIWKANSKKGNLNRIGRNGAIGLPETNDDFVLQLESRPSRNCIGDLFFKCDPENSVESGFKIQLFESHNKEKIRSAKIDNRTTPQQNSDGSKNRFKTTLKDLPRTGPIGFQDHGHTVRFRNVFPKEL